MEPRPTHKAFAAEPIVNEAMDRLEERIDGIYHVMGMYETQQVTDLHNELLALTEFFRAACIALDCGSAVVILGSYVIPVAITDELFAIRDRIEGGGGMSATGATDAQIERAALREWMARGGDHERYAEFPDDYRFKVECRDLAARWAIRFVPPDHRIIGPDVIEAIKAVTDTGEHMAAIESVPSLKASLLNSIRITREALT